MTFFSLIFSIRSCSLYSSQNKDLLLYVQLENRYSEVANTVIVMVMGERSEEKNHTNQNWESNRLKEHRPSVNQMQLFQSKSDGTWSPKAKWNCFKSARIPHNHKIATTVETQVRKKTHTHTLLQSTDDRMWCLLACFRWFYGRIADHFRRVQNIKHIFFIPCLSRFGRILCLKSFTNSQKTRANITLALSFKCLLWIGLVRCKVFHIFVGSLHMRAVRCHCYETEEEIRDSSNWQMVK